MEPNETHDTLREERTLWRRVRMAAPAGLLEQLGENRLGAYLDGMLSGDEIARAEAALLRDGAALQAAIDTRRILDGGAEAPPADVLEHARAAVLRELAEAGHTVIHPAVWRRAAVWSAAATLLIAAGTLGYTLGGQTNRTIQDTELAAFDEPPLGISAFEPDTAVLLSAAYAPPQGELP